MARDVETVIIGGGIAGLACARRLHDSQRPFLLITEDVGGRIRVSKDGAVNVGAYYVRSDYTHVNRFVDRGRRIPRRQLLRGNADGSFTRSDVPCCCTCRKPFDSCVSCGRFGATTRPSSGTVYWCRRPSRLGRIRCSGTSTTNPLPGSSNDTGSWTSPVVSRSRRPGDSLHARGQLPPSPSWSGFSTSSSRSSNSRSVSMSSPTASRTPCSSTRSRRSPPRRTTTPFTHATAGASLPTTSWSPPPSTFPPSTIACVPSPPPTWWACSATALGACAMPSSRCAATQSGGQRGLLAAAVSRPGGSWRASVVEPGRGLAGRHDVPRGCVHPGLRCRHAVRRVARPPSDRKPSADPLARR